MMEEQKCTKCLIEKNVIMFGKNKATKSGYKYRCRECETESQRLRRKKQKDTDPQKVRDKWIKYYDKKKEKIRTQQKIYINKPENRKKRNEYIRNYKAEKRLNDKSFVLYENFRKRIWKCLKHKSNSSKELLGCDIDQYFEWISYTMTNDMSWENYGTYWNIDHLIPISKFNLTKLDELKQAFDWKNTWAMKSKENFSKKNNIICEQFTKHNNLLVQFCKIANIELVISSHASLKEEEDSETR